VARATASTGMLKAKSAKQCGLLKCFTNYIFDTILSIELGSPRRMGLSSESSLRAGNENKELRLEEMN